MSPLLTRSLSGIVYVIIFLSALLYSETTFISLMVLFTLICIYEFHKLISFSNVIPYLVFGGLVTFLILNPSDYKISIPILVLNLFAAFQLIYRLYSRTKLQSSKYFEKLDISLRYIIFSFCFLIVLPYEGEVYNPYILINILILIWVNDSFAFLVGKNFGKTKLFPSVSPKKTVEGFIGGVVFSVITGAIISYFNQTFNTNTWIVIALIMSVIGSIGDLVESNFKRHANVKDSGNIMPGHGGMLDRLDSLFFATPFVYLYLHFFI